MNLPLKLPSDKNIKSPEEHSSEKKSGKKGKTPPDFLRLPDYFDRSFARCEGDGSGWG
jgi:hypothetical protein